MVGSISTAQFLTGAKSFSLARVSSSNIAGSGRSWVPEALSSITTTLAARKFCFVAHGAFQGGIFEPSPENGNQVEVLTFDPPSRAHAEIAELPIQR
jgi:hypothetical protein